MNFKPIVRKYAEIMVERLIKRYDELGLRASGEYDESLRIQITDESMIIFGAAHAKFMEKGRAAGGMPPIPSILRWMDVKPGVSFPSDQKERRRIAWAIATKIANQGIKVPNEHNKGKVISAVVEEMAPLFSEMVREIQLLTSREISSEILGILRAA